MGRKDANSTASMPVDQYRKQIGRHDSHRDKKDLKELKRHREAKKSAMTVKDVVLVFVAGFSLIVVVYVLLYFYLIPNSGQDSSTDSSNADENTRN